MECSICMETGGARMRTLECHETHTFHRKCLKLWWTTETDAGRPMTCPTCRAVYKRPAPRQRPAFVHAAAPDVNVEAPPDFQNMLLLQRAHFWIETAVLVLVAIILMAVTIGALILFFPMRINMEARQAELLHEIEHLQESHQFMEQVMERMLDGTFNCDDGVCTLVEGCER